MQEIYYVGFEDDKITYIDSEKPIQIDVEIIAEDVVVTPAFIDLHRHIGMVRAGEPADEDESNDHMHPIFPLINALHSIYMDDVSFTESVENGVLNSVVLPGSGILCVWGVKRYSYVILKKILKKRL